MWKLLLAWIINALALLAHLPFDGGEEILHFNARAATRWRRRPLHDLSAADNHAGTARAAFDGGHSLTYMASERVIAGYGGGMSSAKAALESDTRTLAFEAGRKWGVRVNTISAGPYASRAASAIGIIERMVEYCEINSPLPVALAATEVGHTAAFLASPLASGITGTTVYVDKGFHTMGMAVAVPSWMQSRIEAP